MTQYSKKVMQFMDMNPNARKLIEMVPERVELVLLEDVRGVAVRVDSFLPT